MASKERFVNRFIKQLRKTGYDGAIAYDDPNFSLKIGDGQVIFLANPWAEYQKAGLFQRGNVLSAFARVSGRGDPMPASFEQAREHLLPRIRDRAYFGLTSLRMPKEKRFQIGVSRRLTDHYVLELVYDLPDSIVSLPPDRLEKWGKSFAEAESVALTNLRALTRRNLELLAPGLYASTFSDTHDCARLLLGEQMSWLKVAGDPVAMPAHRNLLFVTGSEEMDAYAALAERAEAPLADNRGVSSRLLRFTQGGWCDFELPREHPHREKLHKLVVRQDALMYGEQKQLLDKEHEAEGRDCYVADFKVVGSKDDTSAWRSWSVWGDGITDGLLAKADVVVVASAKEKLYVPWSAIVPLVGTLLEPVDGLYPPRFHYAKFPEADVLEKLRGVKLENPVAA